MSLLQQLAGLPAWLASLTLIEWIALIGSIHATASAIAAMTPTPKDDAFIGKVYKVIEILALNFGRAKELPPIAKPAPAAKKAPASKAKARTILLPILLSLTLAACGTVDAVKQADQPREQWALAAASYQGAMASVTELARAGKLDLATAEKIETARVLARAALDEAGRIINDPGRAQADALWWIGRATQSIGTLLEAVARARGAVSLWPSGATPLAA